MDLLKELAASSAKKTRMGKGKREFLALKDEIEKAILGGYSVREIWEFLSEKGMVSIQYEAFSDYVRRYGLREAAVLRRRQQSAGNERLESDRKADMKVGETPNGTPTCDSKNIPQPRGFNHNPSPDKQRLKDG